MSRLKIRNNNEWISIPAGGVGVPTGGTAGQVLKKVSGTNYDTEWSDPTGSGSGVHIGDEAPSDPNIDVWIDPDGEETMQGIPAGGSAGQVLTKRSTTSYDVGWYDVPAAEEGENYIKYPDGTLICWGIYNIASVASTAIGNLYMASLHPDITFPVPFISRPCVSASNHGGYAIICELDVTETGITLFSVGRPNSGRIYPNIGWTAIGRWK